MKLSKRLELLVSFIPLNTTVIDIGCDHGLLDIYLAKTRKQRCIATDISSKCIEKVENQIKKYQVESLVTPVWTDGINGIAIPDNSCLVLSGLGTQTILDILKQCPNDKINSIIIQSNTELPLLRKIMMQRGYSVVDEEVILERKIFYVIMKWIYKPTSYTDKELYLGPCLSKKETSHSYYQYLLDKNNQVIASIPSCYLEKILKIAIYNTWLAKPK